MLKYRRNKNMLCVFIGNKRNNLFWGIFNYNYFVMRVPPLKFVVVSFLLTSLPKDYFLPRRGLFNGGNCNVVDSCYSVTSF